MTGHTQQWGQKAPAVLPQGTLQLQQTRQRWQGSTLVPRIKSRLAQATGAVAKQASVAQLHQQTGPPALWKGSAALAAEDGPPGGHLLVHQNSFQSNGDSGSRRTSLQSFKPAPPYVPYRPAIRDLAGPEASSTLAKQRQKQSLARVQRAAATRLPQHLGDGAFYAHFTPMGQRPNNKVVRVPVLKGSPARQVPLLPSKVSQTALLGHTSPSSYFPQSLARGLNALPAARPVHQERPMQLDVKLEHPGAPFKTHASFYKGAGTKEGRSPDTAYKVDLESLGTGSRVVSRLVNPINPQALNDLLSVMTNAEIRNHQQTRGKTGRDGRDGGDPGSAASPEQSPKHAFQRSPMNSTAKLPDIPRP